MCQNCGAEMTVPETPELAALVCPLCASQNQPPKSRLATGTFLAGYQIIQNIETYSLYETYLAEHVGQKVQVRLQTFVSPLFDTGLPADYFLGAMRKWLKVKQPNIVRVMEAGRNRQGIYYAAQLPVEGITLDDRLWRGGKIALKPTMHLAILISRVLSWLYKEHGIIYGGLSPRNIILTANKDIYLAQMTLAPLLRERPMGLPLSELATGRPGFMSPEQLSAPDTLDCQSDMFSLGLTLYQMLTGKPPYASLNRAQIQDRHKAPSLPDPRSICPELPDKVVWLLEVLLAHDPKDRFSNWDTLAEVMTNMEQGKDKDKWSPKPLKSHSMLIPHAPEKVITIRQRRPSTPHNPLPLHPDTPHQPKRDLTGIVIATALVLMTVAIIVVLLLPRSVTGPEPALQPSNTGSTIFRPQYPATPTQPGQSAAPRQSAVAGQTSAAPPAEPPSPQSFPNAPQPVPRVEPAPIANTYAEAYGELRRYAKRNPADYEGLLDRYGHLMTLVDSNKSDLVMRLEQEIRSIELASAGPLDDAQQAIREKVMTFKDNNQTTEAITWLIQYSGPFKRKTKDFRDSLAASLATQKKR